MTDSYTKSRCPDCDSSDAYTTYHSDGHSYCYSCETFTPSGEYKQMETQKVVAISNSSTSTLKSTGMIEAITERKISKETARVYNTQIRKTGSMTTHHIYQYFDKNGELS